MTLLDPGWMQRHVLKPSAVLIWYDFSLLMTDQPDIVDWRLWNGLGTIIPSCPDLFTVTTMQTNIMKWQHKETEWMFGKPLWIWEHFGKRENIGLRCYCQHITICKKGFLAFKYFITIKYIAFLTYCGNTWILMHIAVYFRKIFHWSLCSK